VKFGSILGFEVCDFGRKLGVARVTRGQGREFGVVQLPKVELVSPSNEHLAWNRGGDFFTPNYYCFQRF